MGILIGLSGKMQSGKDTMGSYLHEHYGFHQVAFGNKLKEVCIAYADTYRHVDVEAARKHWAHNTVQDLFEDTSPCLSNALLKLATDYQSSAKLWRETTQEQFYTVKTPFTRGALQHFGEGMRHILYGHEDVWVRYLLRNLDKKKNYVICDLRYKNEALPIVCANGVIVRINRPEIKRDQPKDNHISETDLDDFNFDFIIENDSSINNLHIKIDDLMSSIKMEERK